MEKNIQKKIQKKFPKMNKKKYPNFFLIFLDGRTYYKQNDIHIMRIPKMKKNRQKIQQEIMHIPFVGK